MRAAIAALAAALPCACTAPAVHEYRRVIMGAECRVLVAADPDTAERAAAAAFRRLGQVEEALSDWIASGEVRALPRRAGEAAAIGPDLAAALETSLEWSRRSEGAFDPTLGALTQAWREARRRGVPLGRGEARDLLGRCGWRHVRLDARRRTFAADVDGLQLDFGGIGQGIGADAAMEAIRAEGVRSALVELSGDVLAGDPPPGRDGWRVRIDDGSGTVVTLRNRAVTTSGDREQHLDAGGERLSHVLDPSTGWPVTTRVQVTAFAPTAAEADALATALCVLGPDRGRRLLDANPAWSARWSWPDGPPSGPGR